MGALEKGWDYLLFICTEDVGRLPLFLTVNIPCKRLIVDDTFKYSTDIWATSVTYKYFPVTVPKRPCRVFIHTYLALDTYLMALFSGSIGGT